MPMIDVYAPKDLLPAGSDRKIGEALTMAVLRAEGVTAPGRAYLENTAAFIHRMEPDGSPDGGAAARASCSRSNHHSARSVKPGESETTGERRDDHHRRRLRRPVAS